ncbi:LysR family transcriptional regulator [Pseudomonas sp. CAN2814]|uniref:LysR family transcriptional regulator n=1 Tax=Pseudomonas sp. CAN1 TaxID=3046726 RepID=UPI002647F329|nr:LysR family transcriptional regulator [Pseudomonas sp. CAN1]MDN6859018.1 LysR family transcriptional regulator [Pseudomonas sp. CAN1]
MLDLNDLYYFSTLAERGSVTGAAQSLGIPKGTLSRRLKALETQLNLRLIDRTTRRFALTEAGRSLVGYAQSVVEQATNAESHLRSLGERPCGVVRMTCPQGVLRILLTSLLPEFLARFPQVSVEVVASGRHSELIAEGFDIGLRSHEHELEDSSLVARRLATLPIVLVARPGYIDATTVLGPAEIQGLDGLCLQTHDGPSVWTLHSQSGERTTLQLNPRLTSDDSALLKEAAIAGQGVAVLPLFTCLAELELGQLERVLPDWHLARRSLSLILPSSRGLMPAVRALADFLIERIPSAIHCAPGSTH